MELGEIHQEALIEFDRGNSAVEEERELSIEDRRFVNIRGAQWEGNWSNQFENRPKIEVNKVHLSVLRIENEYRNNRISVDYTPKREGEDKQAELMNGLFRADEKDSKGQESKDNAFKEMLDGGQGALRLRSAYEDEYDENNEQQRIEFEPIFDADKNVVWDPDAVCRTKEDATFCFILKPFTYEKYKEVYGEDPASWPRSGYRIGNQDWQTKDEVIVAEYFKVIEKAKVTIVYYDNDLTDQPTKKLELQSMTKEQKEELKATGWEETRRRTVKKRKVRKYVMNGREVLEDCGFIAGKHIPVIPFYGQRTIIEGIERTCGHVRFCRDAQILKNIMLSDVADIAASSSREKPIFDPKQVKGLEKRWARDNIDRYAYQLARSLEGQDGNIVQTGPIGYTKPSIVPPATAALIEQSEIDMRDILGNQQQGEAMPGDISGRALSKINNRLDMLSYIYMSNFAVGLEWCGKVYLEMAKDVYVEESRYMRTMDKEGKMSSTSVNVPVFGTEEYENDISNALFGVNVEVGPTSSSKRQALVEGIAELLPNIQDPETKQLLEITVMKNIEGEGMSGVREFMRKKLVDMGIEEPNEEDQARIQAMQENQEPSPNDQYLMAEAANAEADAQKKQAEVQEVMANSKLKEAQAAKILQDLQTPMVEPMTPEAPPNYEEEKILLEARAKARELELKEREIELKEQDNLLRRQEQIAKLAQIGANIMTKEGEDVEVEAEEGVSVAVEVAEKMQAALEGLNATMAEQNAQRGEALETLKQPKTVVRDENGRVKGIE